MEFSADSEMRKIPELVQEFLRHVVSDEESLFISDEATILDVSMAPPEELMRRCSEYYRTSVSREDLKQPLWKLIRALNERRNQAG